MELESVVVTGIGIQQETRKLGVSIESVGKKKLKVHLKSVLFQHYEEMSQG